jgi:hypothetical protein
MLNQYSVAQKSGAVGCAIGFAWLYLLCLQPLVEAILAASDWLDGAFKVCFPIALGLPGIMLMVVSVQLMTKLATRDRIKNVFGVLCGFGTFVCAFLVLPLSWRFVTDRHPAGALLAFSLFISLLLMLLLYVRLSKFVMKRSGIVCVPGEFIGRGCYQMFALILCSILNSVTMEYRDVLMPDTLFDFVWGFGPFIIPYILYRIAVKYWVRDTIEQQVAFDFPSKAELETRAERSSPT